MTLQSLSNSQHQSRYEMLISHSSDSCLSARSIVNPISNKIIDVTKISARIKLLLTLRNNASFWLLRRTVPFWCRHQISWWRNNQIDDDWNFQGIPRASNEEVTFTTWLVCNKVSCLTTQHMKSVTSTFLWAKFGRFMTTFGCWQLVTWASCCTTLQEIILRLINFDSLIKFVSSDSGVLELEFRRSGHRVSQAPPFPLACCAAKAFTSFQQVLSR